MAVKTQVPVSKLALVNASEWWQWLKYTSSACVLKHAGIVTFCRRSLEAVTVASHAILVYVSYTSLGQNVLSRYKIP